MSRGKMGLSKRIALLLVFVFSCTCGLVLLPQKAEARTVVDTKSGFSHTVKLYDDGTVEATGSNNFGQCNISGASDVAAIEAAANFSVVLHNNGVVNGCGYLQAFGWDSNFEFGDFFTIPYNNFNIVAISANNCGYAILRADGTIESYTPLKGYVVYEGIPGKKPGRAAVGKRLSIKCENIESVVALHHCCHTVRCPSGIIIVETTGFYLLRADGSVEKLGTHNDGCTPPPIGSSLWGYRVDINQSLNTNLLNNLIVGNGNLSPSFHPETFNYTVKVEELVSTNITAILASPKTHILKINGTEQSSGVPKEISLVEGSNTIRIDVVAKKAGGSGSTYTISVNNVCKPKVVNAITTTDGKKILLTFDKEMKTPPASPAGFSVFVNGINNPITAVNLNATNKKVIELTLTNKIYQNNINIGVSYTPGTITATDGTKLAGFNMGVVNKSATYGTYNILSAATSTDGNKIFLTCEKEMNSLPASPAGFTVSVKGTANPIKAVTLNDANKKIVELTLKQTILKNHVDIKVSYTPGTVTATDGTKLAVCSGLSVTNNSKITFGPILSLKFDEGSGAIAHDTSGFGNSGILNENVNWCKGIKGNGAYFTGVDSSVAVPHASLNNLSNWTFEAWVKPESSGYIYTEGNPWETMILGITGDNGLQISTWHGSRTGRWAHYTTTADLLTRHKWNHLVVTLANGGAGAQSGVVTCYVNGRCVATESLGSVSNETTKEAEVGRNVGFKEGQNANALKGIIDEVAIYSRVLSAEEIQQNYQKIIYLDNIKITNADDKETPESCTFGAHMSKLEFDLKKYVNELTLGLDLPSNIKVVSVENIYKNGAKIENSAVITADGHEIKFTKPLAVGSYQLDLLFNIDGELVVKTEFYIDKEKNKTNYASEKFELQFMEFDDLPDIL